MEQLSDEWRQIRIGKVTASRVADVVARTKTGYGASRANYAAQLIVERLTGKPVEGYTNAAMQHGIDFESEARAAYEFYQDVRVEPIAFVHHTRINQSGASPDGLVGEDGLVEIKCPLSATHLETLLGQAVPQKYQDQMQWQMACTSRMWCDFVSYDPRMPENMRLFVKRLARDNARIAELEKEVEIFLAEIVLKVDALTKLYGKMAA